MPSHFYQDRFIHTIPLTGLFVEHLGIKVKEAGGLTEENVVPTIAQCLVDCGLVEKEATEAQVAGVIERLQEIEKKDLEGKGERSPDTGKGKYFAGYLTDWATNLNYVQLCLYAADFDYPRARKYFEEVDQQSLIALAHDKLRFDFERARVSFEAALFGFGGKYKDTPGEGDSVIDLTQDGEDANKRLERAVKGLF